jgi:Lysyl oxidase
MGIFGGDSRPDTRAHTRRCNRRSARATQRLRNHIRWLAVAAITPALLIAGARVSESIAARSLALHAGARAASEAPEGVALTEPRSSTTNPCHAARPRLLCPDLVMSTPRELHLDRTTRPRHVLLRATSSINNHGLGALELRARRAGRHSWRVYQALRGHRGKVHLSRIAATLVYKFVPGRRYGEGNVGQASYWKLRHAASMQLWSVDAKFRPIGLVRAGAKVDYCLRDLRRTVPSRRSPSAAVYPACNQNARIRRDVLGTSVGWSDIYPYEYPDQWIDVTGLRGTFALVFIANPDHALLEGSQDNNVSETYVHLPSGRVLGRRGPVSRP